MTTEQQKELYATGDWIAVIANEMPIGEETRTDWVTAKDLSYIESHSYKLIHISHSEVLDHVLSGGKVSSTSLKFRIPILNANDFIANYRPEFEYEIIKDRPDLDDAGSGLL